MTFAYSPCTVDRNFDMGFDNFFAPKQRETHRLRLPYRNHRLRACFVALWSYGTVGMWLESVVAGNASIRLDTRYRSGCLVVETSGQHYEETLGLIVASVVTRSTPN